VPATLQSIEAARNEILARAYLEQLAGTLPAPSDEEIKRYYAEHPALFAERRVYGLEEIHVPLKDAPAALKERVAQKSDLREVGNWLKSRNVSFEESRAVRAAEQLPLEWLPHMQSMQPGEIQILESGERVYIVRLAAAHAAPVDEATARPRIRQFLGNRRLSEAVAKALKDLRQRSNIEYAGEFSGAAGKEAAGASPQVADGPVDPVEKGIEGLVKR
jgi:hypothetical protein